MLTQGAYQSSAIELHFLRKRVSQFLLKILFALFEKKLAENRVWEEVLMPCCGNAEEVGQLCPQNHWDGSGKQC